MKFQWPLFISLTGQSHVNLFSQTPILEYQQMYSKIGVIYEVFKNFGPMQKSIYQKFFRSISIPKSEFYYTPKKWKSTKPFIWARYQLRNSDIDNSFSKKRKYWCIDFTDCKFTLT